MKKIYSFVLAATAATLLLTQSGNAQINVAGATTKEFAPLTKPIQQNHSMSGTLDTLMPPSFALPCADSVFIYTWTKVVTPPTNGYVTGSSTIQNFIGTEVAMRYAFSGTGSVTDVLIWYAKKTGTTGVTSSRVRGVLANKKPGAIMGTSINTVNTGAIATNAYTDYAFSPPIAVTSEFVVSSVLPTTAGDTVAIYSTKSTCNSGDSLGSVNLSAAGWYLYNFFFDRLPPVDTNIDLEILPVVDITSGINSYPESNGLSLLGSYPNPAQTFTTIGYQLNKSSFVKISVFDLSGKIYHSYSDNLGAGKHELKIDLADFPAGNYFYTIKTDEARMTSKFSVTK